MSSTNAVPSADSNSSQIMADVETRPNIMTLMRIGYTIDGAFDPDHVDFRCCFCFHIHKAVKIMIILLGIPTLILDTILVVSAISPISVLGTLSSAITFTFLVIGVFWWRKWHKMLRIYMFLTGISIFLYFGYLCTSAAAVVVALTKKSDVVQRKELEAHAVQFLFTAVLTSIALFVFIVTFYLVYVEYKYLDGRIQNGLV